MSAYSSSVYPSVAARHQRYVSWILEQYSGCSSICGMSTYTVFAFARLKSADSKCKNYAGECPELIPKIPVFLALLLTALSATDSENELVVEEKLHYHFYHVPVQ